MVRTILAVCFSFGRLKLEKTKSIESTGMTQDPVLLKQDTLGETSSTGLNNSFPIFFFPVPV